MEIKKASNIDAESIVKLFSENGNTHNWTITKWEYYYKEYPEGAPVSIIAKNNGEVIGHYAMFPIRISNHKAMLGAHAYVRSDYRGLTVISALFKEVDRYCHEYGVDLIVGFARPEFSFVKEKIFKWKTIGWLGFETTTSYFKKKYQDKKFYFSYSDSWYEWRFQGKKTDCYFSEYSRGETKVLQLLKSRIDVCKTNHLDEFECWNPGQYFDKKNSHEFQQPFSIKVYKDELKTSGIYDINEWMIEMGDSDTFVYRPIDV